MYRKHLFNFPILCSVLFSTFSYAQTGFAPIGAKWWYSYDTFGATGFIRIESIKDTSVDAHLCSILKKDRFTYNFVSYVYDSTFLGKEIVYEENNVVYIHRYDSFHILYDFNVGNNDSWISVGDANLTMLCDSFSTISVDSVGLILINGFDLKTLHFNMENSGEWKYYGDAIQKIGSLGYLLPEPYCINDIHEGGPLRCYLDSEIGFYTTEISSSCDLITSTPQIIDSSPFIQIKFNPQTNYLFVYSDYPGSENNSSLVLNLIDLNGKVINSYSLASGWNQIKLRNKTHGLFFAVLKYKNVIISSHPFFSQN